VIDPNIALLINRFAAHKFNSAGFVICHQKSAAFVGEEV
jgi:hypothetical protein